MLAEACVYHLLTGKEIKLKRAPQTMILFLLKLMDWILTLKMEVGREKYSQTFEATVSLRQDVMLELGLKQKKDG